MTDNDNDTYHDSTATIKPNDRESQFLASQQARLAKIHDAQSKDEESNVQQHRKQFWHTFKLEYAALQEKLSSLVERKSDDENANEIENESGDPNNETKNNGERRIQFVTAQQRNEALEKLQQIQLSILAVHHYTLRSTKSKCSAQEAQLLPPHFATHEMPELPLADLRLLHAELDSLKKRTKDVHEIIIPKEKFRFKRYHAIMLEKKKLNLPIFEEEGEGMALLEGRDEKEEEKLDAGDAGVGAHVQLAFDGLTLSNQKDCIIVVEESGTILLKNLEHEIIETITPSSVLVQAKAFLIRNVVNCQVQVNGLYNSVHVIDTTDTTIQIVSPVHGPVHVTNCKDSSIQIPFSRQLRIHDCTSVTFIIHVASGPIIEGCKGMKFFQRDYDADTHIRTKIAVTDSDFDAGVNLYADVKDFHWLKNNVKSPNFDVYAQSESEQEMQELLDAFTKAMSLEQNSAPDDKYTKNEAGAVEDGNSAIVGEDSDDDDDDDSSEDEL